jgi:competence protein ComEC
MLIGGFFCMKRLYWAVSGLLVIVSSFGLLIYLNQGIDISQAASGYFVRNQDLKVIFLDVGQGDSVLVITPERKTILIDGGPDNTVVYKLGQYLPFWRRRIDLMVLSHPHADHVTGLIEVLKRYQIEKILMTGILHTTYEYETWLNLIKDKNISIEIAREPKQLDFDSVVGLEILYPLKNLNGQKVDNLNNSSIVLKLVYGRNKFLFPGDLEANVQVKILDQDLEAEILKVPHQGAEDSLNFDFLDQVKPKIAIIFAGENNYGHPSRRTIKALERKGAEVLVTKEVGDIVIESDGIRNYYR